MLAFKCVGGGDFIRITAVELDDTGDDAEFPPYTGPVFDELDETLQQAFTDYLDERGGLHCFFCEFRVRALYI